MDFTEVLATFRNVAPEYKGINDAVVLEWIKLSQPFVSRRRFRGLWAQALALLTAHRMKMSNVGVDASEDPLKEVVDISVGALTRVSNFSEGNISIGLNNDVSKFTDLNAEFSLTPYGVQYITLTRMSVMSITSAGEA